MNSGGVSAWKDIYASEIDLGINCYRPQSIQHLADLTKFSRKEIQMIYRGFKQGSPNGLVSADQFKEIYSQFFTRGDSTHYASLVFNSFDHDRGSGRIRFEFVQALSIVSRGSLEEKLKWVFKLYDVDGDGLLTRPDLEKLISSVYALLGKRVDPPVTHKELQEHVDDFLTVMAQLDAFSRSPQP
ncbi:unnamed protein product [Soboliphyme baturini]|uniref:EF-hand domain-containing protein n=1 Tax=Soboliphyme baturini TaxID=241478 RepID=A0A183IRV2_9BILA|nr:unnamed protein product [Soboliphyme baturini]